MSRKYGIHSCRLRCATIRILCCSTVTTARTCNRAGCRSATKQPFSRGKYPTANLWHALYSSSSRTGVLWIRIADFWTRSLPASRFSLGEQSDPPTYGTSSCASSRHVAVLHCQRHRIWCSASCLEKRQILHRRVRMHKSLER